jgi:hypothetical protein
VDISPDTASWYEFEQFITEILERAPDVELTAAPEPYGADYGFDFAAVRDGRPLLIQVTLTTPQTSYRLEQMSIALKGAAERYQELHPDSEPTFVLTFPGVLAESKMNLAASSGLEVWDGPYLRGRARQVGVRVPPYIALERYGTAGLAVDTSSRYTDALLHPMTSTAFRSCHSRP